MLDVKSIIAEQVLKGEFGAERHSSDKWHDCEWNEPITDTRKS